MDFSNVDVEKIYNVTNEIKSIITTISSEIENINNSCDSLKKECTQFISYNGQEVSNSKEQKQLMKEENGEQVYYRTEVTWKEWEITGSDEITGIIDRLQSRLTDIGNIAANVSDLVSNSQLTADAINNYIEKVNEDMYSLTPEQRKILLDTFKNYKAEDEYSAMNGNYVGIDPENEKWWTDDAMYAKYNAATGTVLVYQIVDGQEVGMGYVPVDKWIEGTKSAKNSLILPSGNRYDGSTNKVYDPEGNVVDQGDKKSIPVKNNKYEITLAGLGSLSIQGVISHETDKNNNSTIWFDSDKNPEGKILETANNKTKITTTNFDNSKNYEGKILEVTNNETKITTTTYNPNKNSQGVQLRKFDDTTNTSVVNYGDHITLENTDGDLIATMNTTDNEIHIINENEFQSWKDTKTQQSIDSLKESTKFLNTNATNKQETDVLEKFSSSFPSTDDTTSNENIDIVNSMNTTFSNISENIAYDYEKQLYNVQNTFDSK